MNSGPDQLLDTYLAPLAIAVLSAVPRSGVLLVFASTSSMWHFGQIAETMSRSSDSSVAQSAFAAGSGLVCPNWFTILRQPLRVVHAPRWKWRREVARSDTALGSM